MNKKEIMDNLLKLIPILLIFFTGNLNGQGAYLSDFFVTVNGLEANYNRHVAEYGEPDSVLVLWDAVKNDLPEPEGLKYTDAFALVYGNGERPATAVFTHRLRPGQSDYTYRNCTGHYPCYDQVWRHLVEDDRTSVSQRLITGNEVQEDEPTGGGVDDNWDQFIGEPNEKAKSQESIYAIELKLKKVNDPIRIQLQKDIIESFKDILDALYFKYDE